MKFNASFDNSVTVITIACILLFTVFSINTFLYHPTTLRLLIVFLLWLIVLLSYGLSPQYYSLDKMQVMGKSPWFLFVWPRTEIAHVHVLSAQEMKWSFRMFGVGGLFGYFGIFYNRRLRWMIWFASQRKNYVLLELTNGKKVILTPDNPEEFVTALQ